MMPISSWEKPESSSRAAVAGGRTPKRQCSGLGKDVQGEVVRKERAQNLLGGDQKVDPAMNGEKAGAVEYDVAASLQLADGEQVTSLLSPTETAGADHPSRAAPGDSRGLLGR
jgi:hypothetical protein